MNMTFRQVSTVFPGSKVHSGTIIFLHGSGDTGNGVREWIKLLLGKDLEFSQLKILFPTAPLRPYTPMNGFNSHVWFDRLRISPDVPEHLETLNTSAHDIVDMINSEVKQGVPMKNIIVGGFSMGGAMAMHLGFRLLPDIGGVFALSSFLNDNSVVYQELKKHPPDSSYPPLLMFHGDRDDLVPAEWGQKTFDTLKTLGIKGQFSILKNTLHELKRREIIQLQEWIEERFQPLNV